MAKQPAQNKNKAPEPAQEPKQTAKKPTQYTIEVPHGTEVMLRTGEKTFQIAVKGVEVKADDVVKLMSREDGKEHVFGSAKVTDVVDIEIKPASQSVKEKHGSKFESVTDQQLARLISSQKCESAEQFFNLFPKNFTGKVLHFTDIAVF